MRLQCEVLPRDESTSLKILRGVLKGVWCFEIKEARQLGTGNWVSILIPDYGSGK